VLALELGWGGTRHHPRADTTGLAEKTEDPPAASWAAARAFLTSTFTGVWIDIYIYVKGWTGVTRFSSTVRSSGPSAC
jgi:hypothetical protein